MIYVLIYSVLSHNIRNSDVVSRIISLFREVIRMDTAIFSAMYHFQKKSVALMGNIGFNIDSFGNIWYNMLTEVKSQP